MSSSGKIISSSNSAVRGENHCWRLKPVVKNTEQWHRLRSLVWGLSDRNKNLWKEGFSHFLWIQDEGFPNWRMRSERWPWQEGRWRVASLKIFTFRLKRLSGGRDKHVGGMCVKTHGRWCACLWETNRWFVLSQHLIISTNQKLALTSYC